MADNCKGTQARRWRFIHVLLAGSLVAVGLAIGSAPQAAADSTTTLLPYQAADYAYLQVLPGQEPSSWFEPSYTVDSAWRTGSAAFGSGGGCQLQATVATHWDSNTAILLRKQVSVPAGATNVTVSVAIDNDIEAAYWNGHLIGSASHDFCPSRDAFSFQVPAGDVSTATNALAVEGVDRGSESFLDVTVTATASTGAYAALGDSYSSGEGSGSYAFNSDVTYLVPPGSNRCHRSSLAYAPTLDSALQLGSLSFVACSGAITNDLFASNHQDNLAPNGRPEPPQLNALSASTTTVTLTIGGNDVGFSGILADCIQARFNAFVLAGGTACVTDPSIKARIHALGGLVTAAAPGTSDPIHSIGSILASIHADAPNAHVYIAGYPLLFPPGTGSQALGGGGFCKVGTLTINDFPVQQTIIVDYKPVRVTVLVNGIPVDATISAVNANFLNAYGMALNDAIRAAVAGAGPWATYVSPVGRFGGHGYCESRTPWFNSLSASVDYQTRQTTVDPSSFHPTSDGQLGYEQSFLDAGL